MFQASPQRLHSTQKHADVFHTQGSTLPPEHLERGQQQPGQRQPANLHQVFFELPDELAHPSAPALARPTYLKPL